MTFLSLLYLKIIKFSLSRGEKMYKFTWPVSYLPWSQSWRRDPEPVPVQRQSSGVLPVPVRGRYGWISMLLWLFLISDDTA